MEDYANLITKGRSKVIKKDYLINNSRWRNEADITPPATVYSLGEEAALNRSGNQPSSSTPTSKKTFFDEVLRGVQGLNHEDLTSLISALMMEDKQRRTKTATTIQPSMVGNPVPFKAGGGMFLPFLSIVHLLGIFHLNKLYSHLYHLLTLIIQLGVSPVGCLHHPPITPLINTGVLNQLVLIQVTIQPDQF